ncbi:hypothetical protein NL676_025761 [Syzygium grande]|nr:hypothetical protein NL676_025761 [Syzygium grande]
MARVFVPSLMTDEAAIAMDDTIEASPSVGLRGPISHKGMKALGCHGQGGFTAKALIHSRQWPCPGPSRPYWPRARPL